MDFKLVEDTKLMRVVQFNFGSNSIATINPSLSSESVVHTRLNIDKLGLHSNSTILDANLYGQVPSEAMECSQFTKIVKIHGSNLRQLGEIVILLSNGLKVEFWLRTVSNDKY